MRPDPQHRSGAVDSGRIIYLGDVRRRRRPSRKAPDRYYLAALALIAAMSWAGWLTVVMTLAPSRFLSYLAFFIPLTLALVTSLTIVLYVFDAYRHAFPSLATSLRRASLGSGVVVVNLAALGGRLWVVAVGALSVVAALLIEIALGRHGK